MITSLNIITLTPDYFKHFQTFQKAIKNLFKSIFSPYNITEKVVYIKLSTH